jgi:hypothetical protein
VVQNLDPRLDPGSGLCSFTGPHLLRCYPGQLRGAAASFWALNLPSGYSHHPSRLGGEARHLVSHVTAYALAATI